MSDLLQPGLHPDVDVLNAFAENALPAHERTHTLAHLSACAHCREIVFLAQQAAPLPQSAPASAWHRWRNSVSLFGIGLGAAVLAGAALFFVTLRPHPNTASSVAMHEPQTLRPPAPTPPTTAALETPRPPVSASALNSTDSADSQRPSALKGTGFSPYKRSQGIGGALAPEGAALPPVKPLPPLIAAGPPRPMAAPRGFLGMGAGIGRAPTVGAAAPMRSLALSSVHGDTASQVAATPPVVAVNLGNGLPAPTPAATPAPPTAAAATVDGVAAPPTTAETVTVQNAEALSMDSDNPRLHALRRGPSEAALPGTHIARSPAQQPAHHLAHLQRPAQPSPPTPPARSSSRSTPAATGSPLPPHGQARSRSCASPLLRPRALLSSSTFALRNPDSPKSQAQIVDPTGAVVPGARVEARAGASVHTATTDAAGRFGVSALPPGRYRVSVSSPGFETFSQDLTLQNQERATLPVTLRVGSVSETVTVAEAGINGETTTKGPSKQPVAPPVFQLITTTGTIWLSADGLHWQPQ